MTNAQIALILVFCAFACFVLLRDCANLYLHARKPPRTISAGELYSKGPGDNLLVEVTNIRFTGKYQKLFSTDSNGKQTDKSYGTSLEAVPSRATITEAASASNINPDEKILLRTLKTDETAIKSLMSKTLSSGFTVMTFSICVVNKSSLKKGTKRRRSPS